MTNFRMTAIGRPLAAGVALAALAILPGCVDNDYDLSKDMDLNVTIGTNGLTIPGSSTEMLTLKNLFDLNEDGSSSIKTITAEDIANHQNYGLKEGDYVLIQKPDNDSESTIDIPQVFIDDIAGSSDEINLMSFPVPNVPDASLLPTGVQQLPDNVELNNSVNLNATDVTSDIVSLSEATTDLTVDVTITFTTNYSGQIYLMKGFAIEFPKFWTVSLAEGTSNQLYMKDQSTIVFKDNFDVAHNLVKLNIRIEKFDFTSQYAKGQGLFNENGVNKFVMKDNVKLVGKLGLDLSQATPGQNIDLTMHSEVKPIEARLLTATGKVNPKIEIEESDFQINDIPDPLAEEGNQLDIYNPQLYFTVNNPAPVDVTFSAKLTPYDDKGNILKDKNGKDNIVELGSAYKQQEILIKAGQETRICISRRGSSDANVDENITVANLGDLFMTVPSRITITGIKAQVPQDKEYTITLNETYTEKYSYEAVIPFVFGENTIIDYMTSSDDLDTDDFDKFNFEAIELSFNAVNGIPLNLTPSLEATDAKGNALSDVTCKVTGVIKAGTANGPSTSKITAVLTSTADNLGQVKGINASFTAHTDAECAGIALNDNMGVKFTDVTATLKGNIDLDLND